MSPQELDLVLDAIHSISPWDPLELPSFQLQGAGRGSTQPHLGCLNDILALYGSALQDDSCDGGLYLDPETESRLQLGAGYFGSLDSG